MKKLLCLVSLFGICLTLQAQSYLGIVKKAANFRHKPSMSAPKIATLQKDAQVFIISKSDTNDYYHVIDIESNIEGYLYTSFVQLGKLLPPTENGLFTQVGRTMSSETIIRVFNKSEKTVSLVLNDNKYEFPAGKKEVLKLEQDSYSFRVSSPGMLPEYGLQTIERGYEYIWSFTRE